MRSFKEYKNRIIITVRILFFVLLSHSSARVVSMRQRQRVRRQSIRLGSKRISSGRIPNLPEKPLKLPQMLPNLP